MARPRNILVVSDSLRELPAAVAVLENSRHRIAYVDDLIPFPEIAARQLADLSQADAVVTGRIMGVNGEALSR